MNNPLLLHALNEDKENFKSLTETMIQEHIAERLVETQKEVASEMCGSDVEIVETNEAFVSIINECLDENVIIDVDFEDGNRVELTPDLATIISETHDSLPKDIQTQFRSSLFESKENFVRMMEAIMEEETNE